MSLFKTKSTKKISVTQGGETIELEFLSFNAKDAQAFKFENPEDVNNIVVICDLLSDKCVTKQEDGSPSTKNDFMELEIPTITQIVEQLIGAKNSKG